MRLRRGAGPQGPKKTIATRFGKIAFGRQQFHCAQCGTCVAPRDFALGVAGESYSPGLLRVVALINAETGARRASDLIFESMRLSVGPSQVGRKARAVGEQVQEWELSETAPLDPGKTVRGLAVDGTGIPAGKQEVANRAGKREDGSAKTREVKVATFFDLGPPDRKTGHSQRDLDTVTVTAAIESAASRDAGLPVGSGVVEGACRSLVCERLKKSGMFRASRAPTRSSRCAAPSNPTLSTISGNTGRKRKKRPEELF